MDMRIVIRLGGVLAGLLCMSTFAKAHDLKVLASKMTLAEGTGKTTVYLSWGHRLPVDDLVDPASLERYEWIAPDGTKTEMTKSELSLQSNSCEIKSAGVHQAVACRKAAIFTYVIGDDGARVMKRGPKSAITEGKIDTAMRSVQCAKALVVAGPVKEPVKALGLPIEITPLDVPSEWASGKNLKFQVMVDGKPLPSAEIVARYVGFKPENAWNYATTTNREGIATIRASQAGTWVLKATHKRPAPQAQQKEYDTDSFIGTLSIELEN